MVQLGWAQTAQIKSRVVIARARLILWRMGSVHAFLNCGSSSSFAKATRLPQNVTAPMRPVHAVAIANCVHGANWVTALAITPASDEEALAVMFHSSAPPTSIDAAPPKPLSKATICGIPVIGYLMAITAPMPPPIRPAMPNITSGHAPWAARLCTTGFSKQAATIAIAIPAAPK